MNQNQRGIPHITTESLLYLLAFLLSLILRLSQLGTSPLSDKEALGAFQALHFLSKNQGELSLSVTPQPGYVVLSGLGFAFLGASNFVARFWPAFSGALLTLLPILISRPDRPHLLSRRVGLIMAFGLALSSGLVITSRLGITDMMALSFSLLGIGLLFVQQPILAGISLALALLSGPVFIQGLIMIGLAWIISGYTTYWRKGQKNPFPGNIRWARFGISLIISLALLATLLLRLPQGLGNWFETLPAYLRGWMLDSTIPSLRPLAALIIYQPIAILFGSIAIGRCLFLTLKPEDEDPTLTSGGQVSRVTHNKFSFRLAVSWLIIGLFLILIYPGREVSHLIWLLPPLIGLAAWEIDQYLPVGKISPISILLTLFLVILMGLLWFSLASITRLPAESNERLARLIIVVGILALSALMVTLVQMGWSWSVARLGLAWGVIASLALFSISGLWGVTFAPRLDAEDTNQPRELWAPLPAIGQADLLINTIKTISSNTTGRPDSIDIISEVDRPALRWLLRDFSRVRFVQEEQFRGLPSLLITSLDQETPELQAAYRGQDFVWSVAPGWRGALPPNLINWLTFRIAPLEVEKIILWTRSDLFPGGVLELPTEAEPGAARESDGDPNSDLIEDYQDLLEDQNRLP